MRLALRLLNASQGAIHPIQWAGDASAPLAPVLRRAMLYVPGSNPRMLAKSLDSPADCICYDLEDAVAPSAKPEARRLVAQLLNGERRPGRAGAEIMVRINGVGTGSEAADLAAVLRTRHVGALALPKTTAPAHLEWVKGEINRLADARKRSGGEEPIRIVGMVENARGMVGVEGIAQAGKGHLDALLFAAEDYVGLTRTPGRTELLYPRSRLVTAAKAFGLQAIDLVCTQYKSPDVLREESEEGKRLGFDGKQAIHPAQVETIHAAFAPSPSELERAQRIKRLFEQHDGAGTGAYGDEGEMVDAPVYKQAMNVLAKAKAAGLV